MRAILNKSVGVQDWFQQLDLAKICKINNTKVSDSEYLLGCLKFNILITNPK